MRPQHTWSVLEILLGINDRDQELVLHEKRDTRREISAVEVSHQEGAGDGGGQRKQGESLDSNGHAQHHTPARHQHSLTHPFTEDPDQHRRDPVSVVWCDGVFA